MKYLKSNIVFSLEKRKINGIPVVENVPIRMRVSFLHNRVEFFTGYRIDVAKWDNINKKIVDGSVNKLNQSALYINEDLEKQKSQIRDILTNFDNQNIVPTPQMLKKEFELLTNISFTYQKINQVANPTVLKGTFMEDLGQDNRTITLAYFLALAFADIDIFLLKEENQVDDKDKLFTVDEIREHLLNTLKKMLNVARELNIDVDKSLYSPLDVINKYPKGFFTKREEDFLKGLRKTL